MGRNEGAKIFLALIMVIFFFIALPIKWIKKGIAKNKAKKLMENGINPTAAADENANTADTATAPAAAETPQKKSKKGWIIALVIIFLLFGAPLIMYFASMR